MKKFLFFTSLLISITISAQSENLFGIKAGTNYSEFTPDLKIAGIRVLEYQGKFGFYIGGFYNFNLSNKSSLQAELLIANQGTKIVNGEFFFRDSSGNTTIGSIESRLNEISILIPVIFRFELTEAFFLEVGPQISYALKRKEIIKSDPFGFFEEGENSTNSPFITDFDKINASLNIGIGFKLNEKLDLNLRYSLGFIERDNNYKTSVINLGIEFKI